MVVEENEYRMAAVNEAIIAVRELSFGYYRSEMILAEVACSIPEHRFTVIMGQNGSGKSTLLRTMAGILPYHSGSILVKGEELKHLSARKRSRRLGYLAQHHKAVFPFRVHEVVLTGRASYINFLPGAKDREEADKALDLVGILHLKNRIYSELSGGEQQLVMIARILAQQPEILLMDEPISHLDYNNQLRVIKMIKQLVQTRITVVAVLHDPNMAYLFGDQFIYVHQQNVHQVTEGHPWEHPLVKEIFHDDLQAVEYEGKHVFIPHL